MPKRVTDKKKIPAGDGEKALSFETALHRLEEIVTQLERGEAPLEKALHQYEEGVRLARFCSEQLQRAERRVEMLEDKNGSLSGRLLAPEGETGSEDDSEPPESADDIEEESDQEKVSNEEKSNRRDDELF